MHKCFIALALIANSSLVMAQDGGFYARGLVGQSDIGFSSLDDATAFSIGAGWRFMPHLSVEAGYSDFGDFDSRGGVDRHADPGPDL